MDIQVLTVRFPNGRTEHLFGPSTPQVGDTLRRGEDEWQVAAVEPDESGKTGVTLEPSATAEPGSGDI